MFSLSDSSQTSSVKWCQISQCRPSVPYNSHHFYLPLRRGSSVGRASKRSRSDVGSNSEGDHLISCYYYTAASELGKILAVPSVADVRALFGI